MHRMTQACRSATQTTSPGSSLSSGLAEREFSSDSRGGDPQRRPGDRYLVRRSANAPSSKRFRLLLARVRRSNPLRQRSRSEGLLGVGLPDYPVRPGIPQGRAIRDTIDVSETTAFDDPGAGEFGSCLNPVSKVVSERNAPSTLSTLRRPWLRPIRSR
jgi:hypothetical protein